MRKRKRERERDREKEREREREREKGVSIVSTYDYMVCTYRTVRIKIEICYRSDMLYPNRFVGLVSHDACSLCRHLQQHWFITVLLPTHGKYDRLYLATREQTNETSVLPMTTNVTIIADRT